MILIQMIRNRFLFILFLILLFSLSLNSFASNNHRTPLIETINSSNKLEYSGYYINKSSKKITKDLSYGCNLNEIITKTQNGELNEENIMFFLGYSGWTNSQLLEEINDGCWKVDKGDSMDVFEKSEENLWTRLTKKIKGNSYIWSNAPENLQDN